MESVRFIRALGLSNVYHNVERLYGVDVDKLGIPSSVFRNPMTLIPVSEVDEWFKRVEQDTNDPDVVFKLYRDFSFKILGPLGRWLLSGHDLSLAIRRANYGVNCLQSGAFLTGSQQGSIVKWVYDNSFFSASARIHDSVRVALFMTNVLRSYLGEHFKPTRVLLSGYRKNASMYEAFFGCEVVWNHPRTEVWIRSEHRLATAQCRRHTQSRLAMNFADMDDFLNMPDPQDEAKVVYEIINYSRHFGFPTLHKVSSLLGVSEQQFQRRLQSAGINFTTLLSYVLGNLAVEYLSKHVAIDEVAYRLGYTNVASFNRMFKKNRGITPRQFQQQIENL